MDNERKVTTRLQERYLKDLKRKILTKLNSVQNDHKSNYPNEKPTILNQDVQNYKRTL